MAIQSSKNHQHERTVAPQTQMADVSNDFSLRPKTLDEYIGQKAMKTHLRVAIDSAKIRKTPLEHILFYGPP